jgi:ABC-2 type transport system ATP-binding protein
VIDLKLDAPLKLEAEGVEVLKNRPYSAKLAVDLCKASLDQVVSLIMRDNKVEDITITNPPMEEIITMIYKGEAGTGATGVSAETPADPDAAGGPP